MAHNQQNLTPTVIADKNGKITTVHKKLDKQTSAPASKVPAPSLSSAAATKPAKHTRGSRLSGINEIFSGGSKKVNKAKAANIVRFATPAELAVLDEVLDGFSDSTPHEQSIVKSILLPLTTRIMHADCVHELLTMRSAFNSPELQTDGSKVEEYIFEEYVRGVRLARSEDYDDKLDLTDDRSKAQNTALVRYAYELKKRTSWNSSFQPTYVSQVGRDSNECAQEWASEELVQLITEFPEKVGEMIKISLEHETSDAQRIWAIMQHEGHASLTGGAL